MKDGKNSRSRTPVTKAAGEAGGTGVNRLEEMDIEEVSAVPKGANRKTFTVVKADSGDGTQGGAESVTLEAVMEAVLKLEQAADETAKKAVAKEVMDLLARYAGISVAKSDGGEQAPTTALTAALEALTGVANTLKALAEKPNGEGAGAAGAQVQEALKSAGLEGLPAKVLELATVVTKQAETITGLAKRLAKLEATPGEGHSVASDTPEAGGDKPVKWGTDLAKAVKPKNGN